MQRVPASKARERLADILNRVAFKGERVVLHRHGKNVAAMISVDDLELLEELEERLDLEAVRRARAEGGAHILWARLRAGK